MPEVRNIVIEADTHRFKDGIRLRKAHSGTMIRGESGAIFPEAALYLWPPVPWNKADQPERLQDSELGEIQEMPAGNSALSDAVKRLKIPAEKIGIQREGLDIPRILREIR